MYRWLNFVLFVFDLMDENMTKVLIAALVFRNSFKYYLLLYVALSVNHL